MFRHHRGPSFLLALLAGQGLLMLVASLIMGWWSSSDSELPEEGVELSPEVGIDALAEATPAGSLVLITPTPSPSAATPMPTVAPPAERSSSAPTAAAPSDTAPAQATRAPVPPASNPAAFAGRWKIIDVIMEGANAGRTYTFDVSLEQRGNRLSGGNGGIQLTGVVTGDTATVEYVQPALGLQGTFVWTMTDPNRATGTFTNSYPNSGTSTLERLP